jgi:hypothetical protein
MRNYILLFIIAGIISACNDGQKEEKTTENKITEKEVTDFIKHYDDLWAKRDTSGMKKAIAENYIYFTSTGNTTTRDRIISWFTPSDKYKVDSATRSEISVTINDNTAIVSSRWVGGGSFDGEKFKDDQRCSLTIQKINGELKLISEHCTQIVNQH